jgi:hypothetical protein
MSNRFGIASTIIVVLLLSHLFSACRKHCKGADENTGIILRETQLDFLICEPPAGREEFVINDEASFEQIFDFTCSSPDDIDFDHETLLGLLADGTCEMKFIREVTSIADEKKYHFKVTVNDCGRCKSLGYSYNWVAVPKLPAGWTVSFEIKRR